MGLRLWAAFGPWAPRRLAATDYSTRYINNYHLPTGWDWAAKALDFSAPAAIMRGIPGEEPIVIQTTALASAANANRASLPPPIAQTTSQAAILPEQKPNDQQKTEEIDPTSRLKLPLASAQQTQVPSTHSDPRWPGRPMSHERPRECPIRSNLFRQPHWWGPRRRNNRPPRDNQRDLPASESSASSDWQGWRDWLERKKCEENSFSLRAFFSRVCFLASSLVPWGPLWISAFSLNIA